MSPFIVKGALGGNVVHFTLPSADSAVEIAFKPGSPEHNGAYSLTSKLTTDEEIDAAVDQLVAALEATRAAAKDFLKDRVGIR